MHTVCCCGAAASLQVTQDSCSCLDACDFLNIFRQFLCTANTFCHYDQVMAFTDASVFQNLLNYFIAVDHFFFFGEHYFFCTAAHTAPYCDITCISAHYFHNRASFMGVGCVTQFVQSVHTCVYRCIETDCVFCTTHIQVDCCRDTNTVYAAFGQFCQTTVRTVAANHNQRIQTQNFVDCCCFVQTFFCHHFRTSCCVQDGTAQIHYVGNIFAVHFLDFAADQTCVTFTDTHNVDIMISCCSDNCTDSSVHAGSVTAAGQHTNLLDFLFFHTCHNSIFLLNMKSSAFHFFIFPIRNYFFSISISPERITPNCVYISALPRIFMAEVLSVN